jgi:hypothetical protein
MRKKKPLRNRSRVESKLKIRRSPRTKRLAKRRMLSLIARVNTAMSAMKPSNQEPVKKH